MQAAYWTRQRQNMVFCLFMVHFRYLWARRRARIFRLASVVANRAPIAQGGLRARSGQPIAVIDLACFWSEHGRDVKKGERRCPRPHQYQPCLCPMAHSSCQETGPQCNITHRGARTHDHKVKGPALCRLS